MHALRAQLPEAEVVLVDNGAADARLAPLAASLGNIQLIAGHGNVGYARGNNIGVRVAKGTHVLIMNPDTRLTAVDADRLTALLADEPFGLVVPLHVEKDGTRQFHIAPGRHWFSEFIRDHIWGVLVPREWAVSSNRWSGSAQTKGAWVGGSIFLAHRGEFLRVGGLDERFFIYYEDRELSDRYRAAGFPIRPNGCLVATHSAGGAFEGDDTNIRGMTWAVLGFVQYTYLRDGPISARAARGLLLASYRVIGGALLALSRLARGRLGRLTRKGQQLLDIRRSVTEPFLPEGGSNCYPNARSRSPA